MQLERVDPYYRSIFLVHVTDLPYVLAAENYVIVELVPESGSGEFWAGEVGDGAEVYAADGKNDAKRYPDEGGQLG